MTRISEIGAAIIGSALVGSICRETRTAKVAAPPRMPANAPCLLARFHQMPRTKGNPKAESRNPPTQPTMIAMMPGGSMAIIIPMIMAANMTIRPSSVTERSLAFGLICVLYIMRHPGRNRKQHGVGGGHDCCEQPRQHDSRQNRRQIGFNDRDENHICVLQGIHHIQCDP